MERQKEQGARVRVEGELSGVREEMKGKERRIEMLMEEVKELQGEVKCQARRGGEGRARK